MKPERDVYIRKKLCATLYIYVHAQFTLHCLAIDLYNTKPDVWQNGHAGRRIARSLTAVMTAHHLQRAYKYNKQCSTFDVISTL